MQDLYSDEKEQDAEFDIHKLDIDSNGVKDFFWPLSQDENIAFAHKLMGTYARIVRQEKEDRDPEITPYKLFAKYFVCEAVAVFQGDLLRERCKSRGREPHAPDAWRLWPNLLKKQPPKRAPFLDLLYQGPAKPDYKSHIFNFKRFKKLARRFSFKHGGLSMDGLKIRPPTKEDLGNAVIATQRTDIIGFHARRETKDVIFCRNSKWFYPIKKDEFQHSIPKGEPGIENEIMKAVEKLYAENSIELLPHARDYLESFLSEGTALLRIHYNRLVKKPENLPKHIWTATGGNIWDLMLRLAVLASKGSADGHDHAIGQGVYILPLTPFIELWGANRFVTYNQAQADSLRSNIACEWAALDNQKPDIVHLGQTKEKSTIKDFSKRNRRSRKIKTIAFMATVYDCDFGRLEPIPSNIVAVDWQARLIAHLNDWGYDVLLKIHPESLVLPPAAFEEKLGAKIVTDRLEDILEQMDLVLFDYIYSTTFRTVLETNIPIAIADYYSIAWTDSVEALIAKRCSIVKGYYDDNNRAQIDWQALKEGIERAPMKCEEHDFATRFLP